MKNDNKYIFKRTLILLFVLIIIAQTGCNISKDMKHCDKCSSIIETIDISKVDNIYITHIYDSAYYPISQDQEEKLFSTILNEIFITKDELTVKEKKAAIGQSSVQDITISFCYEEKVCFSIFVYENGEALCIDKNGNEYVICGNDVINIDLLSKI